MHLDQLLGTLQKLMNVTTYLGSVGTLPNLGGSATHNQ